MKRPQNFIWILLYMTSQDYGDSKTYTTLIVKRDFVYIKNL